MRPAADWLAINTIRTLTIDAVQAAQSGHPGAAMALAPVGYTLWNDVLRYDVHDPALAEPGPVRAVGRARLDAARTRCCTWPRCSRSPG